MDFPQAVAEVLRKAECKHLFTMEGAKIKCTLNEHCIPADNIGVLERFVGGKKFKKLAGQQKDAQQLQKFEPFLVPSKRLQGHLFCALTGQLIKASADAARKHMKGQRFLKAKERFMEDDMDLLEEPDDTAKPERRANHRLQRSDDSAAELRASAEPGGEADTSEDAGDSSDAEAHAMMDDLLESDDDSMAAEEADAADEDTAAVRNAEAVTGQELPATGKRKRAQQSAVAGSSKASKPKRTKVDQKLAGLSVDGSKKALADKKNHRKKSATGKASLSPIQDGAKQAARATNGKQKKKPQAKDEHMLSEAGPSKASSKAALAKGAPAKVKKSKGAHSKAKTAAGESAPEIAKAKAGAGLHKASAVKAAGGKHAKAKRANGKAAKA